MLPRGQGLRSPSSKCQQPHAAPDEQSDNKPQPQGPQGDRRSRVSTCALLPPHKLQAAQGRGSELGSWLTAAKAGCLLLRPCQALTQGPNSKLGRAEVFAAAPAAWAVVQGQLDSLPLALQLVAVIAGCVLQVVSASGEEGATGEDSACVKKWAAWAFTRGWGKVGPHNASLQGASGCRLAH